MSLLASIEDHRAMMRDELHFSPSQSRPPVAYVYDTRERALVPDSRPLVYTVPGKGVIEVPDSPTQTTAIGVPISTRLLRYLQQPSSHDTPWASSLLRLRVECRRSHPYHRAGDRPYWRGSLCHQLVTFTVIRGWSVENAAKILRYDNPEPILRNALRYIEACIDADRDKAERRAREDAGTGPGPIPQPVMAHHAVDGLHRQECPQCKRGVVA